MTSHPPPARPPPAWSPAPDLPSAADIRRLMAERDAARLAEKRKLATIREAGDKQKFDAFMKCKLHPDFIVSVMSRIHYAAETGEKKVLLGQFPSEWCTDGGRKITVLEEDWPDTLQGFARELFDFWAEQLKPRGFGLSLEVISFKEYGIRGDIGAFISWNPREDS